jgi:hypothetical protein
MHPKKSDGGQGTATRGSGAIGGFMDVLIELRRLNPEQREDRRRVLTGFSRFDETLAELVIEYDPNIGYTALGAKVDVGRRDRLLVLLRLLPSKPPGMSVKEILDAWPEDAPEISRRTLQRDLSAAVNGGELDCVGDGKARRYGRRGFDTSTTDSETT